MESYSSWFGPGPEAQILAVVGLFDRPAAEDLVTALRQEPAIPGVTDKLVGLLSVQWKLALSKLRQARLILEADDNATLNKQDLDAHPLVREHFGRRLQQQNPAAWNEAHSRLFDHLKDTTEHQPDTLEVSSPSTRPWSTAARRGGSEEACAEVYRDRILRGQRVLQHEEARRLRSRPGRRRLLLRVAVEPRLAVARGGRPGLAAERGRLPPARSGSADRGRRADAGGLSDAIRKGGLEECRRRRRQPERAGADAGRRAGRRARRRAVGGLRRPQRRRVPADGPRTTLADALHQAGRRDRSAGALPRGRGDAGRRSARSTRCSTHYEASSIATCSSPTPSARRPGAGGTAALSGRAAKSRGRAGSVSADRRVEQLDPRHRPRPPHPRPRPSLPGDPRRLLARRREARDRTGRRWTPGCRPFEFLARGLLTRAWLRSAQGDAEGARADLAEAQEIAERGPMPLFLADVHLYRARFFHDRDALAEARRLVDKHGYGRRLGELEDLEAAADSW